MIKAILFDFDGVLTVDKTGSASITKYISEKCGIPLEVVKASYGKYNKALLDGSIVHQDMWEEFCQDVGERIPYEVLTESFIATPLDEEMIALVKQLKEKYFIAMVTDNKADRINTVLREKNLAPWFDFVAVSAELHMGKESREVFDFVARQLGVSADECVFIDNTEKNLTIPNKMGMKTILFDDQNRDIEKFRAKLDSFL